MKYILVTGGVISGLGKGVITSSIGILMKSHGFNITAIKIDPYLNIDAGTMSPYEHGEVFVLDDGSEVDLDLGNYERSLNLTLTKNNSITTGKIYNSVIQKERQGKYLGKTVQVVPHICNEINEWIENISQISTSNDIINNTQPDICLIELGGTIGDIESMPFVEALSRLRMKVGNSNFCHLHVSLIPIIDMSHKTKPTQNTVKEIRKLGLYPDFILCRSSHELTDDIKNKLSLMCHIDICKIISCHDVKNLLTVPYLLMDQKLNDSILSHLILSYSDCSMKLNSFWISYSFFHAQSYLLNNIKYNPSINICDKPIHIGIIGKYNSLKDSYISIIKALEHASIYHSIQINIIWIDAEDISDNNDIFKNIDGIIIPGGFGTRGIEGKIKAAKYARENNIPLLGICFGLQILAIEFAQNILGQNMATSEEFNENSNNDNFVVICRENKVMRLGSYKLNLNINKYPDSKIFKYYNSSEISERFRHRYKINPFYIPSFETDGLIPIIYNEDEHTCDALELKNHKYYVGVQFHPEFKSSLYKPSPIFLSFIKSIIS